MIQRDVFPGRSRQYDRGKLQNWTAIVGGGALTVFGLSRRSLSGASLAAAGTYLLVRGIKNSGARNRPIHVERSVTLTKPVEEVYQFWRNFENLPRFMHHLKSVQVNGERWSHWKARAPLGRSVEWDAEIVSDEPNKHIVWRSTQKSEVVNSGSVQFTPDQFHGGSRITVVFDYKPPAGKLGAFVARLFGENPEQQVREDLRHMKMLLEAGEIATIEGQPSGSKLRKARLLHTPKREQKQQPLLPPLARTSA